MRRWQEAKREVWDFQEFLWQRNRFLIFLRPKRYFDTILTWDHQSEQFLGYYINFQLPYARSLLGFDILDLDLDVVIDPSYEWRWKDEDDYRAGIEAGGIKANWVVQIEKAKQEVINLINQRGYPLGSEWIDWLPDPSWKPAKLPDNWSEY